MLTSSSPSILIPRTANGFFKTLPHSRTNHIPTPPPSPPPASTSRGISHQTAMLCWAQHPSHHINTNRIPAVRPHCGGHRRGVRMYSCCTQLTGYSPMLVNLQCVRHAGDRCAAPCSCVLLVCVALVISWLALEVRDPGFGGGCYGATTVRGQR
jgi:hypothetical protein